MSDIFASVAAGTPRAAGVAASEAAVRIVDPAPELARVAAGESLRGTVVGKDERGHLLVRTNLALVKLAAVRALPVGTEVILQIRSVGPQVVVTLLPLASATAGSTAPSVQPQPTPAAGTPVPVLPANPSDLVQHGQVIRGVLHAAPPMPLLTGLPTAEPGAELLVRILSLGVQSQSVAGAGAGAPVAGAQAGGTPPANGALPASPTGSPPGAASGGPISQASPSSLGTSALAAAGPGAASGTAPAAATPGPTPIPQPNVQLGAQPGAAPGNASAAPPLGSSAADSAPGLRLAPQTPVGNTGHSAATALQGISTEAATKAAGTLPGAAATAAPNSPGAALGTAAGSPAAAGLRVSGLVTATTSSGQPILHTPLGTVTLDTRAALPVGTSLALEIALPAAGGTAAGPALAAAWPSLDALEETLFHGLPTAQMETVARALPQIGPRLASGVLFFLSALNQGNLMGWLAPAAAGERVERGELYERLGREFAGLSRAIETTAGEWRFINLPLWSDHGLRELRCFVRHQGHGGGKGDGGEKATRFVLELELKDHGELQLDGLVRMQRFDLVLRSRRPLPAVVRGDLMALFEETNDIAGYSGRLVFQASHDWFQLLAAQSAATPHEGLKV